MITTRVCLSLFEKMLITESAARPGSKWEKFFGGDKLITEYFENKFEIRFYRSIQS